MALFVFQFSSSITARIIGHGLVITKLWSENFKPIFLSIWQAPKAPELWHEAVLKIIYVHWVKVLKHIIIYQFLGNLALLCLLHRFPWDEIQVM